MRRHPRARLLGLLVLTSLAAGCRDREPRREGAERIGFYLPGISRFSLHVDDSPGRRVEFQFGSAHHLPVTGDWDGDGYDSVGIFSPGSGEFFLTNELAGGIAEVNVPFAGVSRAARPVAGDWDGDKLATLGVYDPDAGRFLVRNRNDAAAPTVEIPFGPFRGDALPVAGDWDGDGRCDVGLYDPGAGTFHLRLGTATEVRPFGPAGSLPLAGDWTGRGRADVGVFDRAHGTVFLRLPGGGSRSIPVGREIGLPLAGRWRPPL